MHRSAVSCASCAAVLLCAAPGLGQEDPLDRPEDALQSAGETVVRSPRPPWERAVAPSEGDGLDVAEALAASGEVVKVRRGGQSSDLVLRGLQRDNLAVTLDHGRLFGACPNRMDPPASHVEAAELELVEVRRGPFDVTAPGALGGSVSMLTRTPRAGAHADLRLSQGSFGDLRPEGFVSYGGEALSAVLGGSYRQSEPFRSGDGVALTGLYPEASANRYRLGSDERLAYRGGGGWGKVGWVPAAGQRVELAYARTALRDAVYPYLLMDAAQDDTDRASAAWRFERWGGLRAGLAEVSLARVQHDMDDERRCSSTLTPGACVGGLPLPYSMRTLASATTVGGRVQAIAGPGEATAWGDTLIGADLEQRRWDATTTRAMRGMGAVQYADQASLPEVGVWRGGLFGEHRRQLHDRVRLVAGLRLDGSESTARKDRSALYGLYYPGASLGLSRTDWLPAGNVRLEVRPTKPVALLIGLGRAARAPDPQERYFALGGMGGKPGTVGRPDLAPAANTEVDAGVRFTHASVRLGGQVFYSWLRDFIVPARLVGRDGSTAKGYENVAARIYGAEASALFGLPRGFALRGALLYSRGDNREVDVPLPEMPPLQAQGALRFERSWVFAELEEVWAARQDRVDARVQETATPAWFVTNARVGFTWSAFQLTGAVRNLLDKQYFEHLAYLRDPFASGVRVPEPGRTLLVSLRYQR